jgi:hypothetical protein
MILALLNRWGRLLFRLRTGESCHCESNWGRWHQCAGELMTKVRHCQGCGWTEFS